MYLMNVFSKFFYGECTRFLLLLVALWSFNIGCYAKENDSLEKTKSEINSVVSKQDNVEAFVQKQDDMQTKKNDSEGAISEFMKNFSGTQKPFKDYPGYWNHVNDFDIEITNIETNDVFPSGSFRLKDLKDNVVILFFTTTWCPNCVKVFQDLDKLSNDLSKSNVSNVKIITLVLGTEDDNAVKNYYKTNKVESLCKFKSVSPLFFKAVGAVPTCFVFNKKSVPVWGFSGAANYGDPNFLNFIESLSKEDSK